MTINEVKKWGDPLLEVSFSVSGDDWCIVQQSIPWKRILKFLEESEKRDNQMSLREKVDLLESP